MASAFRPTGMRRNSSRTSGTGRPALVSRAVGSVAGSNSAGGTRVRAIEPDVTLSLQMTQDRNSRPLTARSVIASTLLGTAGLALPVPALIRAGELFGIAE